MLQSVTRPYPQTQCRAVSGVGVKSSNCFRRLEKSALPSILDTRLSSSMAWNLQSYPTTVLNERMWHIWGSAKHTLTPPIHISRASRPSNAQNLRNCAHRVSRSQPGNYLPPIGGCSPPKFSGHPKIRPPMGGIQGPPMGCPLSKCSASVNNHAVDRQLI